MRHLRAIAAAATLATVGAASTWAFENPQPGLAVSRNGKKVAIRTAYATDEGGNSVKLFFSSATPTCGEILAKARMLADGEVSFELTRHTWNDGSVEWMAYYRGNTGPAPDGSELEMGRIDPTKGAKSMGRIKARLEGFKPEDKLQVDGTFEAIGCGSK